MAKPTTRPERTAHLAWVNADDLQVNPAAQREFKPAWGQQILSNFDIDKFEPPHVNRRDNGELYVMDGQHGTWAYREFFGAGQKVQVWIHEGLTEQAEAEFFLSYNNKKRIDLLPKFKASITAGREVECDIDRIVRSNGCTIGTSASPTSIAAVAALETIYNRFGGVILGRTIRVIRDSFLDGGFERPILLGVASVLARYGTDIDEARLVDKLASVKNGWKGVTQRASAIRESYGESRDVATAAAVIEFYNSGRGGKKVSTWWAA